MTALAVCTGCSPQLFYFLLPENRVPAEVKKLASDDPYKEVKVVILINSPQFGGSSEGPQSYQQLAMFVAKALRDGCGANGERVTIVSPHKVDEWKDSHPNWGEADKAAVGRYFKADYVLYLEVNELSLYDKADLGQIYNGKVVINVSTTDVNHPDDPIDNRTFADQYPNPARPIPVDEGTPPVKFRAMFFGHIAKKLSWYWTAHLPRDGYYED
jgi:hypothetical protein